MTEPRRYGFRSLRFKLALASVVVEVIMLTVLVWNSTRITGNALNEISQNHVESLIPLLNASIAAPLAQRDYATLDERLGRIVRRESLVYVEVRDELGNLAAKRGEVPETTQLSASFETADGVFDQALDITVANRVIGHARYGLNVNLLEATVASLRRQGAVVAFAEIVITFLLLSVLGFFLTRHLKALAQAARALEGGDYSVRMAVVGQDEVADTAHAFNAMAQTVARDIAERERAVTEHRNSEELLAKSHSLLHGTLESTADGILAVDATGKISGYNQRFMTMWGLPAGILATGDDKRAMQCVLDQLMDPDGFLAKVNYLYNRPEMESFDLLEFKDGKFFERYSQPQRIDGKPVGRVWSFRDITARKKNEDMLARFGRILDSSLNEIYVFDSESLRFTQVNQGARKNLGYNMDELKELTPIDIKPEYTRETFEVLIKPLRAGEQETVSFTTKHRRKDGSLYPVEVRLQLSRADSPPVFVAISQNITERERATEEMHKLSSAIEQTADIVVITDRKGVIEYVNPAFEITTGYPSAEAIGRKPSLIKSGQHNQAFYRNLWGTILRGESYRGVLVNRRKDGGLYHEEISIAPLRDAGGTITHFVSTGKDISERIHAEESVRASEEHLRTIIDTNPECITLMGTDGRLIEMNAAGLAMIEADSLEQAAGKPLYNLVLPEHREAFRILAKNVLQGSKDTLVFEIQCLKGTRRWFETYAVPITTRSGETVLLGITRDISERRRAEQRLSYLVHHDELTGLPNRTLFNDRLEQAMIEAERHERLLAVVFLDLDRFKDVNDTLGHEVGDLLLKGVAERLLGAVRRGDTLARLSGDEFIIVLADMAHMDDASRVAQKILDAFTQPFHIAGRDLFMSASLGITLFPFDTHETQELLRNADIAMYRAKETGRNSYQFYAAEMTTKAVARIGMENALRLALKHGEFLLHYQPIVSCREGHIVGVEALVRWQSPELGLVASAQFIPLAEETGLIVPIGEWVLHSACAQLAHWQSIGFSELRMAVNLSPRQFRQKDVVQIVARTLSRAGLAPRHLELEITESVLAQGAEAEALVREISATGVKFSIDDFGTGYSSLSYLKRFPIDSLKIDRSFVRDIPGDADDTAIAMAIIAMAHSLGIQVVAEGVETAEQLAFLCAKSCASMQGYYLSKPLPTEAVTALLQENRCFCAPSGDKAKPRRKR